MMWKRFFPVVWAAVVVLGFSGMTAWGDAEAGGAAIATQDTPIDFPNYGVKLTTLRGWKRLPEGNVNRIARWGISDSTGQTVAFLQVEHERIAGTVEQEVAGLNRAHAAVSISAYTVDGNEGKRVKGDLATGSSVATEMVYADRGKVRYVAMILREKGGHSDEDDALMDEFTDKWRWRELEAPLTHLTFLEKALPAFGGLAQINVPTAARPLAVQDGRTQMQMGIINLQRQTDEFSFRVELGHGAVPDLAALTEVLKRKLVTTGDYSFVPVGHGAALTPWAKMNSGKAVWVAVGIVPLANGYFANLTFTLARGEKDAQEGYGEAARKVMESMSGEGEVAGDR